MKRTYVEISCDRCGRGDFYRPGAVNDDARKAGWIISRNGKHFCTDKCRAEHMEFEKRQARPNREGNATHERD